MNIKKYEKIIKEIESKDIGASTKLYFVYIMKDFEKYQNLSDEQKEKVLDYLYTYWINEELTENTIYSFIDSIFNSKSYGFPEIVENIDALTYQDFENIINEKCMF